MISLTCLLILAKISRTILCNSGESGHPCQVPGLTETASIFLHFISCLLCCDMGLSYITFVVLRNVPSKQNLLKVLL